SSPDSRWEGELFYSLAIGEQIEVALDGPAELIVVTLAAFRPPGKGEMPGEAAAFYKVHVSEDNETLGEVGFESSPPESLLALHGYPGWQVSSPGVFVIKSIEGSHIYRLNCKRADSDDFMLISFYIPRYEP
ncbi:MAG: hypothetical protein U9N45_05000, partial [Gemmatimonadota bacterium]|nr:hypothetical protein [Gemmatimonadota bacterium]